MLILTVLWFVNEYLMHRLLMIDLLIYFFIVCNLTIKFFFVFFWVDPFVQMF